MSLSSDDESNLEGGHYEMPTEGDVERIIAIMQRSGDGSRLLESPHTGERVVLRRVNGAGTDVVFSAACGNRTVALVRYANPDAAMPSSRDFAKVCVCCDGVHLWPRYQEAA